MCRTIPPPLLEADRLKSHFEAIRQILSSQFDLAASLSPWVTGGAREWFMREFLEKHLPGGIRVGTGHVRCGEDWSKQQDIIVAEQASLALPIGPSGLFFPEGLVACIEVKSQLSASDLVETVAPNFESLPNAKVLKVVVTYRLANRSQHRSVIYEDARVRALSARQCPDLIVILDNAPIIRPGQLRILEDVSDACGGDMRLSKFGSYENDKWLGLALLVFEIAQRQERMSWKEYLQGPLPQCDGGPE